MAGYILIPLATLLTAVVGSSITSRGMRWYKSIRKPSWTPPGSIIGAVWTVLYILATISALILWSMRNGMPIVAILGAFALNAVLNALWSDVFFHRHLLGLAIIEALILEASVLLLISLAWPISMLAAMLLIPYALWVLFASYLTFCVWRMNER